jgi:hypothetical protein
MESLCQSNANILADRIFQDIYGRRPTLDDKEILLLMSLTYMEARLARNVDVHMFTRGAAWMYRRLKGGDLTEHETEAARKAALNGKL